MGIPYLAWNIYTQIQTLSSMSGKNPNFTRGLVANLTVATGAKAKNILIFLASCGKVEKAIKAVNNIRTINKNKSQRHKLDKNFTW